MLGKKVRCTITGFTGIATAEIKYINGCMQYQIQPEGLQENGSPIKSLWVDKGQLEIVVEGDVSKENDIGGPPPANLPHFGK